MKNKSLNKKSFDVRKSIGTTVIVISAFLLFCLITGSTFLGIIGKAVSNFFFGLFGLTAFAVISAALVAGIMVLADKHVVLPKIQIANFIIMFFAVSLLIHLMTSQGGVAENSYSEYLGACYNYAEMSTFGGAFSALFVWPLCNALSVFGTYIFIIALIILTVFIAAEYFFKISNMKLEKSEKIITKESYIQPHYPKNKLFVATINDNKQAPVQQVVHHVYTQQGSFNAQPQQQRVKVNNSFNELYGDRGANRSYEPQNDFGHQNNEFERQQKTAREQLYGDRLWQNQDSSAFSARSDMSVQRGATPNTSYTKDFENYYGNVLKNNENIKTAPVSNFNKTFDEPPAILHGDDQYTSDTLNIKKTAEFLAEEKPDKKVKSNAKDELYALKGEMRPDDNLPPIVNGDEMSAQIKRKEAFERLQQSGSVQNKEDVRFGGVSASKPVVEKAQQEKPVQPKEAEPWVADYVTKREELSSEKSEEILPKLSFKDDFSAKFEPVQDERADEAKPMPFLDFEDKVSKEYSYKENKELESVKPEDPIFEEDLLSDGELKGISAADMVVESEQPIQAKTEEPKFIEKPFLQKAVKGFQVGFVTDKESEAKAQKPVHKYEKYVPPVLQLLDDSVFDPSVVSEDYESIGQSIQNTLAQFKVESKLVNIIHGPTVTRYEFEMAPGISVKRVNSLADDISMVVASKSSVRIEAPIPGKNLFGIEVPNKKVAKVPLRSILESPEFQNDKHALTFALGIDIGGQKIIADLADMPHLLIAGSTGQGKSVCMNSLIISMLYKYSPEDLRFILVDPKRVEFSVYNKLPHLMINDVITEPEKAISAFNWLIKEMERRFLLFSEYGVRDIRGYNDAIDTETTQKLPRIVLVVDEVADLMQYNKNEIEQRIQKLAQKARAAGIHLVLATQRPSVDIITGVIKANFPARIALRVTAVADSKTILAQGGPEKLLGKGDMFFQTANMADPIRLQGALILDEEVRDVVNFVAANNESYFDTEVADAILKTKKEAGGKNGDDDDDLDELFFDALKYVIEIGTASISMLQRRFSIGYNRAGRLIQDMEEKHFVSQFEGAKPRQVLITMEEYENLFNNG